jgi:hypothetical protein
MSTYTPAPHDTRATFEEVTEALAVIREKDDENHWLAGDVSAAWLSGVEHGRRVAEIGLLADSSGYTYAGLRERIDCSMYWPVDMREQFRALPWSAFNRARRGAELEEAARRLAYLMDHPMGIDEFSQWCSGKSEPSNAPTFHDALMVVAEAVAELSSHRDVPENVQPFLEKLVQVMSALMSAVDKAKEKA